MSDQYRLQNRVRELRSRLRMRQSDLALEVDVTRQTILAIEKGRLNPSIMVSLKISRVLREPVDYIFYLEHVPVPEGLSVQTSSAVYREKTALAT
jgi:putative transcriptional regulator